MIINKNNKQTKNQESKQANHYEQEIKIKILQTCVRWWAHHISSSQNVINNSKLGFEQEKNPSKQTKCQNLSIITTHCL
jgi:hypothetical protein